MIARYESLSQARCWPSSPCPTWVDGWRPTNRAGSPAACWPWGWAAQAGHPTPYKQDTYRRQGKGRRCWLGDSIYAIPCLASYFALYRTTFEEQDAFIFVFKSSCCNSSYSSNRSSAKIASAERNFNNFVPQAAATTLALSSVFIHLLCPPHTAHALFVVFSFLYRQNENKVLRNYEKEHIHPNSNAELSVLSCHSYSAEVAYYLFYHITVFLVN